MIDVIAAAAWAGIVAMSSVLFFSYFGRLIDSHGSRIYRYFASVAIAHIALQIAGYSIPILSENIIINEKEIMDYNTAYILCILSVGLALAIWSSERGNLKAFFSLPELKNFFRYKGRILERSYDSQFFLAFMMTLASFDGNIFTLASTGILTTQNLVLATVVGLTVIAGPGAWAFGVHISSIIRRESQQSQESLCGPGFLILRICMLSMVIAISSASFGALFGHSDLINMEFFSKMASVAIFLVPLFILEVGEIPIESIPLYIILFAVINNLKGEIAQLVLLFLFSLLFFSRFKKSVLNILFAAIVTGISTVPSVRPLTFASFGVAFSCLVFSGIWNNLFTSYVKKKRLLAIIREDFRGLSENVLKGYKVEDKQFHSLIDMVVLLINQPNKRTEASRMARNQIERRLSLIGPQNFINHYGRHVLGLSSKYEDYVSLSEEIDKTEKFLEGLKHLKAP